jgi:hypothetical protein
MTRSIGHKEGPNDSSIQSSGVDPNQIEIVNLYAVGAGEVRCKLFVHWMVVEGLNGEKVRVKVLFDGGAMVVVMDKGLWKRSKHCPGGGRQSCKTLRMASSVLVPSEVTWEGPMVFDNVRWIGAFEVFDSGGGWDFLFGKPLQAIFGAIHDYAKDIVNIGVDEHQLTLQNQSGPEWWVGWKQRKPVGETGKAEAFTGVVSFANTPARRVLLENTVCDKNDGHEFTDVLRNGDNTTDEGGVDLASMTGVEEVGDQPSDETEEAKCQAAAQSELEVEADANWWLPEAVPPSREISAGVSTTLVRGVLNAVDVTMGEYTDTDRTGGKEPGNSHGGTERGMWWAKKPPMKNM